MLGQNVRHTSELKPAQGPLAAVKKISPDVVPRLRCACVKKLQASALSAAAVGLYSGRGGPGPERGVLRGVSFRKAHQPEEQKPNCLAEHEHGQRWEEPDHQPVTSVNFVPNDDVVLFDSADKTVKIWKATDEGSYDCQHTFKDHAGEVRAVTLHATHNYFVTDSTDKTWGFYDLSSGMCLAQVNEATVQDGFTSAVFHPDGLILGTGTAESLVRIWDVKSQANVAKFEGHNGPVNDISFSENGYYFATAANDGVKLWDLRKLKSFHSFAPYDSSTPTNTVEFDFSGNYLAIGGLDMRQDYLRNLQTLVSSRGEPHHLC